VCTFLHVYTRTHCVRAIASAICMPCMYLSWAIRTHVTRTDGRTNKRIKKKKNSQIRTITLKRSLALRMWILASAVMWSGVAVCNAYLNTRLVCEITYILIIILTRRSSYKLSKRNGAKINLKTSLYKYFSKTKRKWLKKMFYLRSRKKGIQNGNFNRKEKE